MKEVREKGQLSKSKDLTAWLGVGAAMFMIPVSIGIGADKGTEQFFALGSIAKNPDPLVALELLGTALLSVLDIVAPIFVAVVIVTIIGAAAQGGIHFKKFKPSVEHFNLVTGMKRVFGMQAMWEGAKALLKTVVVGLVLFAVVQGLLPVLTNAGTLPVSILLAEAGEGAAGLLRAAVAAGLVLAIADVFVIIKRNRKKTRMTKKEVRDEHKNNDGDPLIKSQRRARQLAMSRNRMIAAVSGADVVLVNPTHIAIALKYEPGRSAPRVVAKGSGHIALTIREKAEASAVPVVQDIPLARALHGACELGDEIPVDFYGAVARVLAFVMALRKRGSSQPRHSIHTIPVAAY